MQLLPRERLINQYLMSVYGSLHGDLLYVAARSVLLPAVAMCFILCRCEFRCPLVLSGLAVMFWMVFVSVFCVNYF